MKSWTKRFFILKSDFCLYYYKDTSKGPLGTISLHDPKFMARTGEAADISWPKVSKTECRMSVITTLRTYFMYSDSSSEIEQWIDILTKAAAKARKSREGLGIGKWRSASTVTNEETEEKEDNSKTAAIVDTSLAEHKEDGPEELALAQGTASLPSDENQLDNTTGENMEAIYALASEATEDYNNSTTPVMEDTEYKPVSESEGKDEAESYEPEEIYETFEENNEIVSIETEEKKEMVFTGTEKLNALASAQPEEINESVPTELEEINESVPTELEETAEQTTELNSNIYDAVAFDEITSKEALANDIKADKERPPLPDKEERPPLPDKERPPLPDKDEHPPLPDKDEHPPLPDKDEHPPLPDKDEHPPLPDKDEHPPLPDKDERPLLPDKENNPPLPDKEERPPLPDKEERPPLLDKDERPPLPDKEERPLSDKEEVPEPPPRNLPPVPTRRESLRYIERPQYEAQSDLEEIKDNSPQLSARNNHQDPESPVHVNSSQIQNSPPLSSRKPPEHSEASTNSNMLSEQPVLVQPQHSRPVPRPRTNTNPSKIEKH